jgi:serine/threonine protein kinase
LSDHCRQSRFRPRALESAWQKYLAEIKVAPIEPAQEKDWSGRGEHIEYSLEEESQIPLQLEGVLGYSASALVESVRCRRIRLARETINCHARLKKEDAINEVTHLQRVKHCHIIQVVGTYVCGKKLSILLYPVAEFTLDTYMERLREDPTKEMQNSFEKFFGCLAMAVDFMHERLTKHMDIKPKNLLIKDMACSKSRLRHIPVRYKIIVADFGIARSYASAQESVTGSPTSFTRTYASPEVINQAPRSFKADIFSLGCVMLEMLATFCDTCPLWHGKSYYSGLMRIRSSTSDVSYQANALHLIEWLRSSIWQRPISTLSAEGHAQFNNFVLLIIDTLNPKSETRPTSSELRDFFALQSVFSECICDSSPDPYEAAAG